MKVLVLPNSIGQPMPTTSDITMLILKIRVGKRCEFSAFCRVSRYARRLLAGMLLYLYALLCFALRFAARVFGAVLYKNRRVLPYKVSAGLACGVCAGARPAKWRRGKRSTAKRCGFNSGKVRVSSFTGGVGRLRCSLSDSFRFKSDVGFDCCGVSSAEFF
jgi:hypothetical protein